ncbi:MAG: PqqD family protein [Vicinamibacteria bacterium]
MGKSRLSEDGVLAEFTGDEAIVLDTEAGRYHPLNATATFIWKALENDQSDEEIVEGVVGEFDVTRERAAESLRTFLSDLATRGFLREPSSETAT